MYITNGELWTHDMVQLPTCEGDIRISQNLMKTLKNHISWMDYPFLSKFWMFNAKKYSTFNEFIFFSEYSVLLTCNQAHSTMSIGHGAWCTIFPLLEPEMLKHVPPTDNSLLQMVWMVLSDIYHSVRVGIVSGQLPTRAGIFVSQTVLHFICLRRLG